MFTFANPELADEFDEDESASSQQASSDSDSSQGSGSPSPKKQKRGKRGGKRVRDSKAHKAKKAAAIPRFTGSMIAHNRKRKPSEKRQVVIKSAKAIKATFPPGTKFGGYKTRQCKLNSLLNKYPINSREHEFVTKNVDKIQQAVFESSKLHEHVGNFMNFDVLRRVKENEAFPNFDELATFTEYFRLVCDKPNIEEDEDKFMRKSAGMYKALNPTLELPPTRYTNQIRNECARQYMTTFANNIVMNQGNRVVSRVMHEHGLNKQQAMTLVTKAFSVAYCAQHATEEELDKFETLKDWCPHLPFDEAVTERYMADCFLTSMAVLEYCEANNLKLFSVVPLKSDFIMENIWLNPTTLYNIYQRLTPDDRRWLVARAMLNPDPEDDARKLARELQHFHASPSSAINEALGGTKTVYKFYFSLMFDWRKYEKPNLKFDATNGYAASPLYCLCVPVNASSKSTTRLPLGCRWTLTM